MKNLVLIYIFCVLVFSCKKIENPPVPEPTPQGEITYTASLPEGKLPWPHHRPEIPQSAYENLKSSVFVLNNFGQYQCGDLRSECYFHDALDVMLRNGTPIFAIQAGRVVAELGQEPFYKTLIIADENDPNFGWAYTHIQIQVDVGQTIQKGQKLGVVSFQGLEHTHLARVRKDNSWQSFSGFTTLYPNDYFEFNDTYTPIIESPFYYFENDSDWQMDSTLHGKVDIVVGMRDPGEYTANTVGNLSNYGNRNAVRKVSYKVKNSTTTLIDKVAFDFSKLQFRFSFDNDKYAGIVYKFHGLFYQEVPNFWNAFLSHYIITNSPGNPQGELDLSYQDLSWDTEELNELGEKIFPNGKYYIEVTAEDALGNTSTNIDSVLVHNP